MIALFTESRAKGFTGANETLMPIGLRPTVALARLVSLSG
jgi:hypothetical protein